VHAAVSLCAAAACLAGSVYCYRHRDGVLRFMTRVRGYDPPDNRRLRVPPGARRRYQRGTGATLDMLSPVLGLFVLALVFLVSGVLELR
jgi:hypothetical protein